VSCAHAADGVAPADPSEAKLIALVDGCLALIPGHQAALRKAMAVDSEQALMASSLYGDGPREAPTKWGDCFPSDNDKWRACLRQSEDALKDRKSAADAVLNDLNEQQFAYVNEALEIKATTFRGLVAKAQIACSDGPDCQPFADLAYSVLHDLLAMTVRS
jgi:hypothetical protein